eukprot:CAMPEP_0184016368 /NCGR_PEP_ID=MMETSP0954-20121128/6891_1 /TAXON_ID=627963 /ORGANISM="Aplanochytrium sp, Strain PBS07" /LENGTH=246 /DNA_ID=CAMNT_0026297383 /DNA_START=189 /DNA_END=929 /DNA_ORIENTATION=-
MPGWVLYRSLFTVFRNQYKFRKRSKVLGNDVVLEDRIFRYSIMDLVSVARKRLMDAQSTMFDTDGNLIYTEKHIPGLGKNFLTENSRKSAIEAYGLFLEYYALMGLLQKLKADNGRSITSIEKEIREAVPITGEEDFAFTGLSTSHGDQNSSKEWEHQKYILRGIIDSTTDKEPIVPKLLSSLVSIATTIIDMVKSSKSRDDVRGRKIIPMYEHAHIPAGDTKVVRLVTEEMELLQKEAQKFLVSD